MAGEKKRRRLRRSRYVETLNQNQISPTTLPQTTLDQPTISIDTDRNLNLDLRQTGSRSIDQPRSDPDSENRRSSRSTQRRPSFRSIHTHKDTVSNKTVLCHYYKQVTGSNFEKSWNLSSTVSFHSWSVVCSYVKS